jgi:hypothetical protein
MYNVPHLVGVLYDFVTVNDNIYICLAPFFDSFFSSVGYRSINSLCSINESGYGADSSLHPQSIQFGLINVTQIAPAPKNINIQKHFMMTQIAHQIMN